MIYEIMYDPSFLDFMVSFELYDFWVYGLVVRNSLLLGVDYETTSSVCIIGSNKPKDIVTFDILF